MRESVVFLRYTLVLNVTKCHRAVIRTVGLPVEDRCCLLENIDIYFSGPIKLNPTVKLGKLVLKERGKLTTIPPSYFTARVD